jgi:hypothetical protein
MNSIIKFSIYCLVILFTFNIKGWYGVETIHSTINYGNYLKNYYHIPSYNFEKECLKNSFYENLVKHDYVTNKIIKYKKEYKDEYKNYIPHKTKLDKIVIFF